MSKIKEYYFNEINHLNEEYENQLLEVSDNEFFENYFEENKERFEAERIFNLTNTYPF